MWILCWSLLFLKMMHFSFGDFSGFYLSLTGRTSSSQTSCPDVSFTYRSRWKCRIGNWPRWKTKTTELVSSRRTQSRSQSWSFTHNSARACCKDCPTGMLFFFFQLTLLFFVLIPYWHIICRFLSVTCDTLGNIRRIYTSCHLYFS